MGRLRPFTICGRNATESSQNPGSFARSLFLLNTVKYNCQGENLDKEKSPRCWSNESSERRSIMDGYHTDYGFMGLVNGEYMLFATDTEYLEYVTDD